MLISVSQGLTQDQQAVLTEPPSLSPRSALRGETGAAEHTGPAELNRGSRGRTEMAEGCGGEGHRMRSQALGSHSRLCHVLRALEKSLCSSVFPRLLNTKTVPVSLGAAVS